MSYDVTDFEREVVARSFEIPVVVDFWADWCAPCRILGPILERLASEGNGRWVLAKVDTERMPDVAARYGVRSIPNVKLFVDGRPVKEFVGALPEAAVRQWLAREIPSPHTKRIGHAEALLLAGNIEDARKVLDEVLVQEPENHKARVLLARSWLGADPSRAARLVEGIEQDSDVYDVADAIRTVAALVAKGRAPEQLPDDPVKPLYREAIGRLAEQDYDAALEKFIEVIRQQRYYDDDGSRKACVAVFRLLGEEHEITMKHRRDFGSALYI